VAKKPKRARAPRKKKETGSTEEPIAAIQEAAVETIEVVPPPAKKTRRAPAKKAAEPVAEVVEPIAEKPKRAPRPRKKTPAAA